MSGPFKVPERVRCDFCAHLFHPTAFNDRTCIPCENDGAPQQSKDETRVYDRKLMNYRRERARRAAEKAKTVR